MPLYIPRKDLSSHVSFYLTLHNCFSLIFLSTSFPACHSVFGVWFYCSDKDHRAVWPGYLPSFPDLFQPCAEGQGSHGGGSVEEAGKGQIYNFSINPFMINLGQTPECVLNIWQLEDGCVIDCILQYCPVTMNEVHMCELPSLSLM